MALYPLRDLHRLRPVAAADYFLRNRALAWFALRIIGILPLRRGSGGGRGDPLACAEQALARGGILLIFPEGSRCEPEQRAALKPGIAHLAKRVPRASIVPIRMEGLGKVLPRDEGLLVPIVCDLWVEPPIQRQIRISNVSQPDLCRPLGKLQQIAGVTDGFCRRPLPALGGR